MASKKTGKKKARKKGRTAAQKAATAKLVAMNKGKKTGKKKSRKKKGSKKAGKRRAHKPYTGGDYTPHKRYKPSVGEQFAGERGGQRFHGPLTPAQALAEANRAIEKLKRVTGGKGHRKASKRRSKAITKHHSHGGKSSGVVTAASILKGAKSNSLKLYVCAGKKFTGCGGGRKGAHVVGHLRA